MTSHPAAEALLQWLNGHTQNGNDAAFILLDHGPALIRELRDLRALVEGAPVGIVRERGGSLAAIIGELPPESIVPEVGKRVRIVPVDGDQAAR